VWVVNTRSAAWQGVTEGPRAACVETSRLPTQRRDAGVSRSSVLSQQRLVVRHTRGCTAPTRRKKARRRPKQRRRGSLRSARHRQRVGLQICLSGHRAQNPNSREASRGFASCLLGICSSEAVFSLNSLPCRGRRMVQKPNEGRSLAQRIRSRLESSRVNA